MKAGLADAESGENGKDDANEGDDNEKEDMQVETEGVEEEEVGTLKATPSKRKHGQETRPTPTKSNRGNPKRPRTGAQTKL